MEATGPIVTVSVEFKFKAEPGFTEEQAFRVVQYALEIASQRVGGITPDMIYLHGTVEGGIEH